MMNPKPNEIRKCRLGEIRNDHEFTLIDLYTGEEFVQYSPLAYHNENRTDRIELLMEDNKYFLVQFTEGMSKECKVDANYFGPDTLKIC